MASAARFTSSWVSYCRAAIRRNLADAAPPIAESTSATANLLLATDQGSQAAAQTAAADADPPRKGPKARQGEKVKVEGTFGGGGGP